MENSGYISNNRNGYETNLLSLQTAHYFINHEEIKDEYVQEMNKGRDYLIEELNKMNVSTQGGEYGNFIFIHTDPNNADKLADQGILVRKCLDGIRLTLGPRTEMEKFVVVFRKI